MKKLIILILLFALHSAGNAQKSLSSGSLSAYDSDECVSARIDVDASENAKSLNLHFNSLNGIHGFSFGFLIKEDGLKTGFVFGGKYAYNFPILKMKAGELRSESQFAGGLLSGSYAGQKFEEISSERFSFQECLFGVRQYLAAKLGDESRNFLKIKVGGEKSQLVLFDDFGSSAQWDNYGFGIRGASALKLADGINFRTEAYMLRKQYNPDLYFFLEKWVTDLKAQSEINFTLRKRVNLIPSFGYRKIDVERDGQVDFECAEFGSKLIIGNVFVKGIYAPWSHKQGKETLLSVGVDVANINAEVYRQTNHNVFSDFARNEEITGFQLRYKFGNLKKHEIKGISDYGVAKKYQNYTDSGVQDDHSLTLKQQAERLGTIRKRNEYGGNNLQYIYATNHGWGFREPDEVYELRGGDCDEQAYFNVTLDKLNGYKAYNLNYYDFRRWLGHGVEIVQDKTNGQWFLDEYGMIYKINVNPDSNLKTVAIEALKQNYNYLALGYLTPGSSYFEIYDYQSGEEIVKFQKMEPVPTERKRPQIEYGSELFTKRNFLFPPEE